MSHLAVPKALIRQGENKLSTMWNGLGDTGFGVTLEAAGCAVAKQNDRSSVQSILTGKSEQEISACTGELRRRLEEREKVRSISRQERTVLERSFPSARDRVPCPHHGCEAHVILQNGRRAEGEYHPFPDADGDCDRIFVRCGP